ncbi:MAG: DMT family transporter [Chitinophagales bacterium]|nr:DMT family transporter [Chitinophagales bacterium]MDW8427453.1 DMT family transporter [Chitinophagales bacterium]
MLRAQLYLHFSIFLWGFTGIFGKAISLNEGMLVWYRMGLTALIWLLVLRLTRRLRWLGWITTLHLVGIGVVLTLHWLFFYASIKHGNISVAMSCLAFVAVFSSLLEPLLLRRPLEWVQVALAVLALFGMLLIFQFTASARLGIALGLISAFLGSLFTILNKRMANQQDSEHITAYEIGSGFLFLSLLLPVYLDYMESPWLWPSQTDGLLLLLFVVFCTVVPFNLAIKSLKHVSAFTANLSLNLEPVYGILLAMLIYREHRQLGPGFYVGMSLVLVSVMAYGWYRWIRLKQSASVAPT